MKIIVRNKTNILEEVRNDAVMLKYKLKLALTKDDDKKKVLTKQYSEFILSTLRA